jgi:uncharacterized NAD(P)/FAD-binding protein YdhS
MSIVRWQVERPTVAIVGGGASGLLLAAQLLRTRAAVRIVLVEERPRLGRGVAYDTTCDAHLLNVPAAGMSGYPDDPGHFTRWAGALLETTSIPEIREQAAALARILPGAALTAAVGTSLEEAL